MSFFPVKALKCTSKCIAVERQSLSNSFSVLFIPVSFVMFEPFMNIFTRLGEAWRTPGDETGVSGVARFSDLQKK